MSTPESYKAELDAYLKTFGATARTIRTAQRPRISQESLSYAARLHRTEIGRIERGLVEPRLTTLVILADGLHVSLDDLADGLWVPLERKPPPTQIEPSP